MNVDELEKHVRSLSNQQHALNSPLENTDPNELCVPETDESLALVSSADLHEPPSPLVNRVSESISSEKSPCVVASPEREINPHFLADKTSSTYGEYDPNSMPFSTKHTLFVTSSSLFPRHL